MQPHTPFIINLDIHPRGYTFHSLQQSPPAPPKLKKSKPPVPKSRIANRLIKEIGLNHEIPPVIPQENAYSRDIYHHPEDLPKIDLDLQEEEELDCEVKRETALPESPASWFDLQQIHEREIEHFGEYFSGKGYKTPELFRAYRNFMVEAYLRNPKRYLAFVPCRRVLKGDVSSLLKIYSFLNAEGIVNYCLGTDGNYDFKSLDVAQVSEMGKKPTSCLKKVPEKSEQEETSELDTDNLTVTVINKNFSRSYRVYCDSCKLICGVVWFTQTEEDDRSKNLCVDCYNSLDREEANGFMKTDITKKMQMSKESRSSKSSWGLEDNIKLLDFMGDTKDKSWSDVENQFQTKKTLEDIVLQFMQFPITNFDPYQHEEHLSHPQLAYRQQQYVRMLLSQITMLEDLYKASPYSAKQEDHDYQEPQFYPSPSLPNFKAINSMFLSKISGKVEQLRTIETIWEETNLSLRQQSLVRRVRSSRGAAKEQELESSSVKNEED